MIDWLAENKDGLLVIASFLAAGAAMVASWMVAQEQKKNRRALIRERLIGDFRVAMSEFLALADRTLNPNRRATSESYKEKLMNAILSFFKADNAIELIIPIESEKTLEEFRDAIQDMKFAYSNCDGEFEARSKVISMAKRIIRQQLQMAREGK